MPLYVPARVRIGESGGEGDGLLPLMLVDLCLAAVLCGTELYITAVLCCTALYLDAAPGVNSGRLTAFKSLPRTGPEHRSEVSRTPSEERAVMESGRDAAVAAECLASGTAGGEDGILGVA